MMIVVVVQLEKEEFSFLFNEEVYLKMSLLRHVKISNCDAIIEWYNISDMQFSSTVSTTLLYQPSFVIYYTFALT